MTQKPTKELLFVASSGDDLKKFPEDARQVMGFALYQAQMGAKSDRAKPLRGFSGAGVVEVIDDYDGNAYRTVYTVRHAGFIYVLHAFQKKSKRGKATPGTDQSLIKSRLKLAEADFKRRSGASK